MLETVTYATFTHFYHCLLQSWPSSESSAQQKNTRPGCVELCAGRCEDVKICVIMENDRSNSSQSQDHTTVRISSSHAHSEDGKHQANLQNHLTVSPQVASFATSQELKSRRSDVRMPQPSIEIPRGNQRQASQHSKMISKYFCFDVHNAQTCSILKIIENGTESPNTQTCAKVSEFDFVRLPSAFDVYPFIVHLVTMWLREFAVGSVQMLRAILPSGKLASNCFGRIHRHGLSANQEQHQGLAIKHQGI